MIVAYISREYKFLFLSAPATGSSAVIRSFEEKEIGEYYPADDIVEDGKRVAPRKHTSIRQLEISGLLAPVADYFRFVGIRNPFSWHVAKYLRNKVTRSKQARDPKSWINKLPEVDKKRYIAQLRRQEKMTFEEFIFSSLEKKQPFAPQADFHIGMDFFLHQERLEKDMDEVKARLQLPADLSVPLFNVTNAMEEDKTYRDFYDERLVDLVYEKNKPFFDRFPEYSFDGLSNR